MPQNYLHAVSTAQMFRQLFGKIYRAVLAARASKRHHQAFKPATLIALMLASTSDIALAKN